MLGKQSGTEREACTVDRERELEHGPTEIDLPTFSHSDEEERREARQEASREPDAFDTENKLTSSAFRPEPPASQEIQREPHSGTYRYCRVFFPPANRRYAYRCDEMDLRPGDWVIVPSWASNRKAL